MAAQQSQKDFFAILGLDEKAGPEELRRVYLSMAVKYHPDRNPDDPKAEERFKDISQAYAVLSDPASRARYERLRPRRKAESSSTSTGKAKPEPPKTKNEAGRKTDSQQSEAKPENNGPAGTAPEPDQAEFDEILTSFFKSGKGRETLRDLEGAFGKAGLKFKMNDVSKWLKARSQRKPAAPSTLKKSFLEHLVDRLPGAKARSRKKAARYDISYSLSLTSQTASTGTSVEISYIRDEQPQRLSVKIPAGTKSGTKLRLAGQGLLKPDQSRGDLILNILVNEQNVF